MITRIITGMLIGVGFHTIYDLIKRKGKEKNENGTWDDRADDIIERSRNSSVSEHKNTAQHSWDGVVIRSVDRKKKKGKKNDKKIDGEKQFRADSNNTAHADVDKQKSADVESVEEETVKEGKEND